MQNTKVFNATLVLALAILSLGGCDAKDPNNSKKDNDKTIVTSCTQLSRISVSNISLQKQSAICSVMVTTLARKPPVYLLRDLLRLVLLMRETGSNDVEIATARDAMDIVRLRQQQNDDESIQNTFATAWRIYQSTETNITFDDLAAALKNTKDANTLSDYDLEKMSIALWQQKRAGLQAAETIPMQTLEKKLQTQDTLPVKLAQNHSSQASYAAVKEVQRSKTSKHVANIVKSSAKTSKHLTNVSQSSDKTGKHVTNVVHSSDKSGKHLVNLVQGSDKTGRHVMKIVQSSDKTGKHLANVFQSSDKTGKQVADVVQGTVKSDKSISVPFSAKTGKHVVNAVPASTKTDKHIVKKTHKSSTHTVKQVQTHPAKARNLTVKKIQTKHQAVKKIINHPIQTGQIKHPAGKLISNHQTQARQNQRDRHHGLQIYQFTHENSRNNQTQNRNT
jgi:hypothetical protein